MYLGGSICDYRSMGIFIKGEIIECADNDVLDCVVVGDNVVNV